jgi:hypothetical protein
VTQQIVLAAFDQTPGFEDKQHHAYATAARKQIGELLDSVNGADPVGRTADLGTENGFQQLNADAVRLRDELSALEGVSLASLTTVQLGVLVERGNQLQQVLARLKAFKPGSTQNPGTVRNSILEDFRKTVSEYLVGIRPIAYLGRVQALAADLHDVRRLADDMSRHSEELLVSHAERYSHMEAAAEQLISQMRETLASTSVSTQAQFFKQAADQHAKVARFALNWVVGLSVLTAVAVAVFAWFSVRYWPGLSTAQAVQIVAAKALIISVCVSGIVLATRTHRAHQHNEIVNRHRVNALSTFDAFTKAAGSDADTKNAVLLHASTCIFSAQPSGYAHGDADGLAAPQILDIAKVLVGRRD